MGATIVQTEGYIEAHADELHGARIYLDFYLLDEAAHEKRKLRLAVPSCRLDIIPATPS